VRLTLLSRAYCHLCDEMLAVVAPVASAHGATLTVIDVDADPVLEARFGERVPVLFLGDAATGTELGHYVCDIARLEAALGPRSSLRSPPPEGAKPS